MEEKVEIIEEEPVEEPKKNELEANITFDSAMAEDWLRWGWKRLNGVVESMIFEPKDMPSLQMPMIIRLACQAIKPGGVIYFPKSFATKHEIPLKKGKAVGKYTEFHVEE